MALLDRDTLDAAHTSPSVVYLPVSMIENLLIDPDVIFRAIAAVRHKTAFQSPDDVALAIDAILDKMLDHEVSRRIKAGVPSRTFRLEEPVAEARRQVEHFTATILRTLSPEYFANLSREAAKAVERVKEAVRRRELYDGKMIMDSFFRSHLHDTGMSKEIFVYTCAKEASSRQSVSAFIEALFTALGIVPPQQA